MLKLLICLTAAVSIAVGLVHLRQQRLELTHDTNTLHDQIELRQAKLWNQQLRIAAVTTPGQVDQSILTADLKLTPLAAGE